MLSNKVDQAWQEADMDHEKNLAVQSDTKSVSRNSTLTKKSKHLSYKNSTKTTNTTDNKADIKAPPSTQCEFKKRLKIVIVGDGMIGKTCLIGYYKTRKYIDNDYKPTIFENTTVKIVIDEVKIELALWDTSGQDDYSRIRPLSYPDADCIMCCYSIDRFDSFNNITEKWINEVRHYCGEIPIVLVGLKSDLRLNVSTKGCCVPISLPKRLEEDGLVDIYIECSAKDGTNIDNCFEKAAMLVQKRKLQTRKKKCLVM